MLNEERIRLMTKAAEFEAREGREAFKVNEYFRGDYVTFHMVKAWIGGTIAFLLGAVLWLACRMEQLLAEMYTLDFAGLGMSVVKWYVLFIIVYELIVFLAYYRKYTRVREAMKEYYAQLRQISGLYEQEDQRLEGRDATGGRGYDDDFV